MPQTSIGLKYRVRYGGYSYRDAYSKVNPRNTLVTIEKSFEKDRYVYFGIARCKLTVDRFTKKEGRELALSRAEEIMKDFDLVYGDTPVVVADFYLKEGGTMGWCAVKYVKTLLRHFESLDQK